MKIQCNSCENRVNNHEVYMEAQIISDSQGNSENEE